LRFFYREIGPQFGKLSDELKFNLIKFGAWEEVGFLDIKSELFDD